MNPTGLVLLLTGLFSLCGAVFDWEWFINSRRGRRLVDSMGRNGARRFYGLVGFGTALFGGLITFGVVELSEFADQNGQAPNAQPAAPFVEYQPPVADGAVEIQVVDPTPGDEMERIVQELIANKLSRRIQSQAIDGKARITLLDTADAQAVSEKLNFVDVVKVDPDQRRIEVRVDIQKLPALHEKPKVEPPSQSGFSFSFGNTATQTEKLPARKQPETSLVETTVAGVVLEPKEILDGKVKLLMPKEFSVMSADMLEVKYPDAQRPTLVFTNEKGTVNLAFNHTKNKATAAAIPVFHRQTEAMMRRQIAAENWLASEMITLDELNWFRLDFRTPAVDTTIRNITLGTSLENRILLVSFNTTTAEEEAWLPIGQQMIQSLRISR